MELKLAKSSLENVKSGKSQNKITLEEVLSRAQAGEHIFYFDKENSHKDMQKAKAFFEKAKCSVYLNEVRYGLDESSYIYELHLI